MAVYALVELEITDEAGMAPYGDAVLATVTKHGGRYLVRAGKTEVVEGGPGEYPVKFILEFPSLAAARGWYDSAEYRAILPSRTANARGNFLWVEGVGSQDA